MNPFERPEEHSLYPQLGSHMHQPEPPTPEQRIVYLEARLAQMEMSIRELCNAFYVHQQIVSQNFHNMERAFYNLVQQTMRPPRNMLGGHQEEN